MKKIIRILNFFVRLLLGYSTLTIAKPMMLIGDNVWQHLLPIYIANCESSKIGKRLLPKTSWTKSHEVIDWVFVGQPKRHPLITEKNWEQFKEENKNRRIVFVVGKDPFGHAGLYKIDGKSLEELAYFSCPFPIKNAQLMWGDVYDKKWRTLLVLNLQSDTQKAIFIFDVTRSNDKLEPEKILTSAHLRMTLQPVAMSSPVSTPAPVLTPPSVSTFSKSSPIATPPPVSTLPPVVASSSVEEQQIEERQTKEHQEDHQIVKPAFCRLKNGQWVLILDQSEKTAQISIHPVDDLDKKIQVISTSEKNPLRTFTLIDKTQQGFVEEIFALDSVGTVWLFNLDLIKPSVKKLTSIDHRYPHNFFPFYILPDVSGEGLKLYFGEASGINGLFIPFHSLQEISNHNLEEVKVFKVAKGVYQAMYFRFGNMILIPSDLNHNKIKTFALTQAGVSELQHDWQTMLADSSMQSSEVIASRLLWNPKNEQDVLITLNHHCQIHVQSAKVSKANLGRISWCKKH